MVIKNDCTVGEEYAGNKVDKNISIDALPVTLSPEDILYPPPAPPKQYTVRHPNLLNQYLM